MQTQTNNPIILSGDKYEVVMEKVEGLVFLHLNLSVLTHNIVKELREVLNLILDQVKDRGHNIVFMTTSDKKIVKLWNMIKPCFEVEPIGNNIWLGSWLTFNEGET